MYNIRNCSTLYVDPINGVDRYQSGLTPERDSRGNGPLKTLDYAFRVVRNLRACGYAQPMNIALCNDYYVKSPINVTSDLSDLTITSYGERKRIIGGLKIENWYDGSFMGVQCLCASVAELFPNETPSFTDLYVNGERAKTTRYPKNGTLEALRTDWPKPSYSIDVDGLDHHSRWFIARREDLEGVEGIEDAIVNYYHFWIDEHSPIESFDKESMKITMSLASRFTSTALYEQKSYADIHYYLSNVPTTFSSMGEWYLDRKAKTVYYIPRDGETKDTLEAFLPIADSLLTIKASGVHVNNLELCVTKCDYESHTYVAVGADELTGLPQEAGQTFGGDEQAVCGAPGAITISGACRVNISNCHIHSVGIHAIDVTAGSHHVRIENNEIEDIAAGGIKIFGGKYGSDEKYHVNDCFIIGNRIHHLGRRYEAGCGILICHAHDNVIEGNEIHHLGYTGISVGWVWGYGDSETYGNIIKGNHVHHIGYGTLSDMGGIYLLGKQRGTVVSENRIHDVTCENYGASGIYLDEGTSSVIVENNVVFDTQSACFVIHYGAYNVIRNNIFAGTRSTPIATGRNELVYEALIEKNVIASIGSPIYGNLCGVNTVTARANFLFDPTRTQPVMICDRDGKDILIEDWQNIYRQDVDSIVIDPEFASIEKRDFTIPASSVLYSLGFNEIPEYVTRPTPSEL